MGKETTAPTMMHDKEPVGKLTFADGSVLKYLDADKFVQAVKEELPYFNTTGLKIEVLTDDPKTRKAVDDEIYNLYGERNPRSIEEYTIPGRNSITPTMTM